MESTRKLRIISLRSEALTLEEAEYEEKNPICVSEFNRDFHYELEYAHEQKAQKEQDEPESSDEVIFPMISLPSPVLKKMHKKLALATHPDHNPGRPDIAEEFKEIQQAFEEKNGPKLMNEIIRRQISVNITEAEALDLEKQLDQIAENLRQKKMTCAWVWYNSNKKEEGLRKRIRMSMGIKEDDFQAWLKKKLGIS